MAKRFPRSNEDAKQRVIRLGEDPEYVFNVGCPRIDLVARELERDSAAVLNDSLAKRS